MRLLLGYCTILPFHCARAQEQPDWRYYDSGHSIYSSGYIDQPYVVVLDDASWLCVFTTGAGKEGQGGQHVVSSRSEDYGQSWSPPVDIEPADGPAASWAMPYRTDFGRVYAFYDYNGDRVETLSGRKIRNDMLGWYCYRYTDDGGLSWSERHRLPVRTTACDRANDWQGAVHILWGIDKADDYGDGMVFGFTKLGKYVLDLGEGWFFRCDNINTERDPEKLAWQMLPEGDHGVRHPEFGSVQEEHNVVPLADGSLYCVYRTRLGHPAESYSRDGGKTWTEPALMRYADGTLVKNPRACPRLFRCANGKYLFWFHNHSGTDFDDRNPAWIAGGIEQGGLLRWSQPEILLYSHDTSRETGRFSYPDLVEQGGRYWVTSTNKATGRVHEVPADFLDDLWAQLEDPAAVAVPEPVFEAKTDVPGARRSEILPYFAEQGFTLDFVVSLADVQKETSLIDLIDAQGKGMRFATTGYRQIALTLLDGEHRAEWTTDPGLLTVAGPHHITCIVDHSPGIISWVVDGKLCDGGESRQFGWTRYDRALNSVLPEREMLFNRSAVQSVRLYDVPLTTSQAIAVYENQREPIQARY